MFKTFRKYDNSWIFYLRICYLHERKMINKDFKDNVILINVIPLIIIPIGKDYSKIMFFIGLSILLVCTILEIGMLYKIGKENKKNIKKEKELIVLSILDSLMLLQYQPFL